MSERFDSKGPRVGVMGYLSGPQRTVRVRFVIDTGASLSVVRPSILQFAGYEVATPSRKTVRMTTVSGVIEAPVIPVKGFYSLEIERSPFAVVAYDFASQKIDGLLGLDFLRFDILTLDFHHGTISLRPPRPRWQFWR